MELFTKNYGIIPACDVSQLSELKVLVNETCSLDFVVGYKIGMQLVINHGIRRVLGTIQRLTGLPVVYDHQKFGTDIPEICGGPILTTLKDAGVSGIIVFPQSGIETLRATVDACKANGLTCIAGGEMTHKGYLVAQGGYISDDGPQRMYADAAKAGVDHFVVPGTSLQSMKDYSSALRQLVTDPKFLFPGIGKGQGGDIVDAFAAVSPFKSYAIVGRGIYAERDKAEAAKRLWQRVGISLPLT